jgi:hypothetical protein
MTRQEIVIDEYLSIEELHALDAIRRGDGTRRISTLHKNRFVALGWVDEKYGGLVLTAVGRFQLEIRARESGLSLLARRWHQRASRLQGIAASTKGGGREARDLAMQWEDMAKRIEALERAELAAPFLTSS